MSILRKISKLIAIAETKHPRLENHALWNVAKRQALLEAAMLETEWEDTGAREGSLENEKCQEPESTESSHDLNAMLTKTLGRPPLGTSPSSKAATNVVSLPRSKS